MGSFAVHIGDHLRFVIICGPIWGSFPVWGSNQWGRGSFAALYSPPFYWNVHSNLQRMFDLCVEIPIDFRSALNSHCLCKEAHNGPYKHVEIQLEVAWHCWYQDLLSDSRSTIVLYSKNRPFAGSSHMVRNKLHWDANNAVGLSKQRNSYQSSPTFLYFQSPMHSIICVPA